jgi:hypothetical protein
MTISALNPVLASIMGVVRKNTPAAEMPADTTSPPDPEACDTALTGSTSGQLSADTKTTLLSYQEDQPAISLKSIRQMLFERYDSDQNGTIDDNEWQQYLGQTHKLMESDGQPVDFRNYDPAAQSQQVYPTKITLDGITTHVDA